MPFDPFRACIQPYPITSYQPAYFLAESFKDAKEKLRYVTVGFGRNRHLFLSFHQTIHDDHSTTVRRSLQSLHTDDRSG